MTTTMTKPMTTDEFASDEFAANQKVYPWIQVLNSSHDSGSGLFITADNAIAVDFRPDRLWTPFETTFANGETESGFKATSAMMMVLAQGPLMMVDRDTGTAVGKFQRDQYDRSIHYPSTKYFVYLVNSENGKLMHDIPLMFNAKKSFGGSFGEHLRAFRGELEQAAFGSRRSHRFHALGVFSFATAPVLKGSTQQSWACSVIGHSVPTPETWRQYFKGYEPKFKDKIFREIEEYTAIAQSFDSEQF